MDKKYWFEKTNIVEWYKKLVHIGNELLGTTDNYTVWSLFENYLTAIRIKYLIQPCNNDYYIDG